MPNHIESIYSTDLIRPRLIAVKQAAAVLGLGLTSTWALISVKRLEVVRIGRRTLVVVASLDSLVASLSCSARGKQGDDVL